MGVGLWNDFSLTASPLWLSRQAAESLRVPKLLSAAETDSLSVSAPPRRSDPSHLRVPISRSPPQPPRRGPVPLWPFHLHKQAARQVALLSAPPSTAAGFVRVSLT